MSELEKVTAVDTTYDASEIQVLEGLEAVRKRPGMYIGSTSASGLHHLVYEIVDNAIDEALAGYCTEITVTINPGDTITVTDNGRGIPVDIQKQTGRPALEVVYTVLHAGGKFGGGGYKVSGGLHGVGASVVNALSEWLEVQVQKDGRIYEMKFSRGAITQEMKILGDTDQTGTAVTFKPDPEMFDTLVYDYETLHTRMREQAFLNAGLRITITDARPGQEQSDSMCYEGGIREFVTWLNRNKTALHEEVVYLAGAKGDSTAEVALQYNDSYNETLVSFANDIHTPEGGMHETGFKTALTRVLNAYGMKYGMIKEGDKVSGEDVPGGHHRRDLREADGGPVRGTDQGQAGQRLHPHPGGQRGIRPAGRVSGGAPGGGPDHPGQGPDRQPRPGGRPESPGVHSPQDCPGRCGHARQAPGLQRE